MIRMKRLSIAVFTLGFFALGCENMPTELEEPRIDSIIISPSSATVEVLDTLCFTVTVYAHGNISKLVRWSTTIGTIDQNGCLTAPATTGLGKALVQSTADTTKFSRATVTVSPVSAPKLQWVKFRDFGGTQRDAARAVAIDHNGNIIVGGIKWTQSHGDQEPFIVFMGLDPLGNELWTTELTSPSDIRGGFASKGDDTEFFFTGPAGRHFTQTLCGSVGVGGEIIIDLFTHTYEGSGALTIRYRNNRLYIGELGGRLIITNPSCDSLQTFTVKSNIYRLTDLWVTQDHILASGDFPSNSGFWNSAGFIRKFDLDGNLRCEMIYDDAVNNYVVEDGNGVIYVGGTQLTTSSGTLLLFIAALNQDCNEMWRVLWDGDNPRDDNISNYATDLILNPRGGAVLTMQLQELVGNPKCTTAPNCWDFGAWAIDASGTTLWTIRQDFNNSPWDFAEALVFDEDNNLIMAGRSTPQPTGSDATDNVDWAIAKFLIPSITP